MVKEWHIWDFPNNIIVCFNEEFRLKLYNKLKEICGTRIEIAKRLGSNKETIRRSLFLGLRNGRESYIFAGIVKKIVEVFGTHLGTDFLNEMDRTVIAYRSWNGWNVKNPILPIKENPSLYSVIFHLIGDGNASKRHSPFYCSPDKELIEEFERNLQIFGDVEVRREVRKFNGLIITYFPKAIADILSYIMKIRFTHPNYLPRRIFDAPLECKVTAIRAFVDDEGSVSINSISSINFCISQKSKNILLQLKQIMNSIGIESGNIGINKKWGVYRLNISNASCKKYLKFVGFSHERKRNMLIRLLRKNELIKSNIEKSQKQYKILELLNKGPLTKHEIASRLSLKPDSVLNILMHLKNKEKIIGQHVGTNKPHLWSLRRNSLD